MRRNCNLELRPVPPSVQFNPPENDDSPRKQQLTIFYNGKIVVCDVTDLQARSIISLASRDMDPSSLSSPITPIIQPQTPSPNALSVKASLQRFLQKRNYRAQSASPYRH